MIPMENVKEREKKWCVFAEGFDNIAGLPIVIHQRPTALSINDVWEDFSKNHYGVTFTHIFISEVK